MFVEISGKHFSKEQSARSSSLRDSMLMFVGRNFNLDLANSTLAIYEGELHRAGAMTEIQFLEISGIFDGTGKPS